MATRVSGRFAPQPPPFVDLQALPRPQVVDADGFELSDEQLAQLAAQLPVPGDDAAAAPTGDVKNSDDEANGDEDADEAMDVDGDNDDEADGDENENENAEEEEEQGDTTTIELVEPEVVPGRTPLMSISERYVHHAIIS